MKKLQLFDQNHGLSPCLLFKSMFILSRKSVFDDLFARSMTWEYRGLQGVTGGYKGLQGVTWGYKGLTRVTGGDMRLQGVTKDDRNLFLTRTFPDSFSWSILHKNQS